MKEVLGVKLLAIDRSGFRKLVGKPGTGRFSWGIEDHWTPDFICKHGNGQTLNLNYKRPETR